MASSRLLGANLRAFPWEGWSALTVTKQVRSRKSWVCSVNRQSRIWLSRNGERASWSQDKARKNGRMNVNGVRVMSSLRERNDSPPSSNVDYLSSLSNPYVKFLVTLRRDPAIRLSTCSVLVMGSVPLREICDSVYGAGGLRREDAIIKVLLVKEDARMMEDLTRFSQRVVRVSDAVMSKITGLDSPPEASGVLRYPPSFLLLDALDQKQLVRSQIREWCPSARRVLVLEGIQDPGNLGTLIRTAVALGWDGLILLPGCCDPFNDKAMRAARGACFQVPIAIGKWQHVKEIAGLKGLKLYAGEPEPVNMRKKIDSKIEDASSMSRYSIGSDDDDVTILGFTTKLRSEIFKSEGFCLVLGSEGQGLSRTTLQDCISISIPMPGRFESLNVAVAGGILMFLLS